MTRDCPRLLRGKSGNTGVPHAHPSIELLYARGREGFTKKKEMSGSKSKHHGLAPKTGGVLITCRLPSPACAGEGPCWRVIGRRSDFAPSATLGDRERTRDGHGGGLGSYTGERAHVSRSGPEDMGSYSRGYWELLHPILLFTRGCSWTDPPGPMVGSNP
jgi:hypothetical protein